MILFIKIYYLILIVYRIIRISIVSWLSIKNNEFFKNVKELVITYPIFLSVIQFLGLPNARNWRKQAPRTAKFDFNFHVSILMKTKDMSSN